MKMRKFKKKLEFEEVFMESIPAPTFIEKLQKTIEKHPEGTQITVGLSYTNMGPDDGGNLAILVEREETDQEYDERIKKAQEENKRAREDQLKRDEAQLSSLAKKLNKKVVDV